MVCTRATWYIRRFCFLILEILLHRLGWKRYNMARARTTHPAVTYNMSECPSPELYVNTQRTPRRKKYTLSFLFLFFTLPRCLPAPAKTSRGVRRREGDAIKTTSICSYLHQALCSLKEMLATLRLGTLLMPVDDCLIRHTVLVIQDLQNVGMVLSTCHLDLHLMSWQRTFKICGNAFMIRVSS